MKINEKVDMRDTRNAIVVPGLSRNARGILVVVTIMVGVLVMAALMGVSNHYAQANATPVLLHNVKIDKVLNTVRSGRSSETVTNTVVKGYTKSGKYVVTKLTDDKTPSVTKSGKDSLSTTLYKDDMNRYYTTK